MGKLKKVSVSFLCLILVFCQLGLSADLFTASAATYMVRSWSELKNQVKNASDGTKLILGADITTDELDNRVIADKKKNVTVDLFGHSIKKKNGSNCYKNGHIFEIQGYSDFTITDTWGGGSLEYGCGNNGGAINIHDGSKLTINNVTFQNNRAGIDGGAVFNRGTLKMNDCVIKNNTAKDTGGGIFNSGEGTFELKNVEICYNKCDNDGGGLNIHTKEVSVMTNCNIHHNTSKDEGAGFRFDDGGETLKLYNTSVKNNTSNDDGGGFYLEDGTIRLYGCNISGNKAHDGGGFYTEDKVVLEKSDYGPTVVSDNTSTHDGGGIYTKGETTINSGEISNNTATMGGAGVFVATGKCRFNGGKISNNYAIKGNGGGIYIRDAEMWIRNGEVSDNIANNSGGGVFCWHEMDELHVSQAPVIKNNYSAMGKDLLLYSCDSIDLDGKLNDGAHISFTFFTGVKIAIISSWEMTTDLEFNDDVTSDYSDHMGNDDPSKYFYSADKYKIVLKGGEVQVTRDRLPADSVVYPEPIKKNSFIPWNEQIADDTKISGNNWLSGISGERKLNEINTPVTHDSSMKEVSSATKCIGSFDNSHEFAITQYHYIDQQLEEGVRRLDLRVNNKRVWKKKRSNGDQKDDGKNLFMCHGTSSAGGTYFAEDPDTGYPLNFLKVLGWIEDFLRRNPTEYVMVTFKAETQHDSDVRITYHRLEKILKEHIDDINPTTGEPYFYLQNGIFGKYYNDWPQLKKVRGKIVICSGKETDYGAHYGGLPSKDFNGRYYVPEQKGSYKDSADERLENIREFAKKEIATRDLPADASRLIDSKTGKEVFVETGSNCVDAYIANSPTILPLRAARIINPKIYGPGKIYSPENTGKYLGWISSDGATALTNAYVYNTNYFDGLQYVTVNVLSGKDNIPNQTFKLLKGTEITIPRYIYDVKQNETNGYFTGWSIGNGNCLEEGKKYTVNSDVTFKANWTTEFATEQTRATIVWKDGDNKDGLRPDELKIDVNTGVFDERQFTVKASNNWTRPLPDLVANANIIVNWDKASANTDGAGTYKYDISGDNERGWVITLTHTPSDSIDITSKVSFFDDVNTYRPASVTFGIYEKGSDAVIQQKDFAIGENGQSEQTFSQLPKYKDGEEINYEIRYISCTNNSGNTTDLDQYNRIISGSDVEYHLRQSKDVDLNIFWIDIAKENRPNNVDVQFKNKDTGTVYSYINYENQDESNSSVCTFNLPVDSVSEDSEDGIVNFDKYDVEINTQADGVYFHVFKNEDGYYIIATGASYESDVALVEAFIDAIGTVTTDNLEESRKNIETAELVYNLLSESAKENVTNYDKLVDARKTYDNTVFARVIGVVTKIAMLQPKFISYNDTCLRLITSARNAYDQLTDIEKERVPNYDVLVAAEELYAQLEKKALESQKAVDKVIDLIDDIGEVVCIPDDLDNDSFSDIDSARSAYNDLSDEEKALVTNYDVLLEAEERYGFLNIDASYDPSITAADALDLDSNLFELPSDLEYKKASILGVQRKELITTDTEGTGMRFVAELSSEYVDKDNVDYGFEVAKTQKETTEAFGENGFAKMNSGTNVVDVSCKGTTNNIAGREYGNNDADSTTYKYVTLAITDIDDMQNVGVAVRFYVKIDGVKYYAGYTNSDGDYRGCCTSYNNLLNAGNN